MDDSLGGEGATLATLWVLEKRLKKISPFCITFGCPLVGNIGLVEAVGRENWIGNFCHVVSKHDIVPQMLLVPFESIVEPLIAIFPCWQSIMVNGRKMYLIILLKMLVGLFLTMSCNILIQ